MSRPGRALIVAAIATLACRDTRAPSPAPPPDAPPAEIVDSGACPFEGCQLGQWIARETVPVYDRIAGPESTTVIRTGDSVIALSAQVTATPRRAVVEKVYKSDEDQGLRIGSVVYALYPIGEGAVAVWHDGRVKRGSRDLSMRYDEPLAARPLQWTWWVEVRLADGRTGWIKNPQRQFDGMDARGN